MSTAVRSVRHMSKAGGLYFTLVFGAGFLLGVVRVTWVVPRVGERAAELLEAPIMLAVTVLAAKLVARRLAIPPTLAARLGVGCVALSLLVTAELALVLSRGLTIGDYAASRDPVAGAVYLAMLVAFTMMPWFVARRPDAGSTAPETRSPRETPP